MYNLIKLLFSVLYGLFWILTYCTSLAEAQEVSEVSSRIEIYKVVEDRNLKAHILFPPGHKESDARPAFVFLHGGGWYKGQAENGLRMCRYWAEKGMVSITFEYRLASLDRLTPLECIKDAKSAILWVRGQATKLGVDPGKIVATGGSAGGHLAVSTALLKGFEETDGNQSISSSPDAVIVWSAAVNIVGDNWFKQLLGDRINLSSCSPAHHIRPGLPPMALLHGTEDKTVPYGTIKKFTQQLPD
jgi:acetyl esterase